MNKARRKEIEKAVALLEEAKALLEPAAEGEREFYDNMPEGLQAGDKGSTADEAAGHLEEAVSSLDDILGNLGGIE